MKIAVVSNEKRWRRWLEQEFRLCREYLQPIEVTYLRDTKELFRAAGKTKFDVVWICEKPEDLHFAGFFESANRVWDSLTQSRSDCSFRFNRASVVLAEREIWYIQSEKRKIYVCTATAKFQISTTMKAEEERFLGRGFLRIHRSTLVNPRWIRSLEPGAVVLKDGRRLLVGERREKEVRRFFGQRIDREAPRTDREGGKIVRGLLS